MRNPTAQPLLRLFMRSLLALLSGFGVFYFVSSAGAAALVILGSAAVIAITWERQAETRRIPPDSALGAE